MIKCICTTPDTCNGKSLSIEVPSSQEPSAAFVSMNDGRIGMYLDANGLAKLIREAQRAYKRLGSIAEEYP